MSQRIVVTGTDAGIGKSVFSAGLAHLLGANYWKPIQAGVEAVFRPIGSFRSVTALKRPPRRTMPPK